MSDINKREITNELEDSYLTYAMSVIVSRALPDVRDGLKPVQRRILWDMWDSGLRHNAKFRKSANVVGQVLGRYHPHGDLSVYDAMVRMAQDFSFRYPLAEGQGNFGSIDGDPAAAYRYTEARLSRIAEELLVDIEKDTVDWRDNYDGTRQEPTVLPAKLPALLLSGGVGIAVGMATSIPPHNLTEIADAVLHLADNPEATSEDLMEFVSGPDFPTGGIIFNKQKILEAYRTGRGSVTIRAKTQVEEHKKDRFRIVITEIPYQVNKSDLVSQIAQLHHDKKIDGISDLRDESDRDGLRIVVDLKKNAVPQKVLNQLFKRSRLQKNFNFNMIALVDGLQPELLSLRDILAEYVKYRKEVIRRRTQYDLDKAEARAHILEGLVTALDKIDAVIETIKKSKDRDDARKNLVKKFKLSELQTNAILEMQLQRLAALEREKIEAELKEKKELIKELTEILEKKGRILQVLKDEVTEIKDTYGDGRRTSVIPSGLEELTDEDLIPEEESIITLSQGGYIKRLPATTFSAQKRGGKGLIGSAVGEDDFLVRFSHASSHDNALFFSNTGKAYHTKVYNIPAASRTAKGRAVYQFLGMSTDEHVSALITYPDKEAEGGAEAPYLLTVTAKGQVKKTPLSEYVNIRSSGIIALSLKKGDALRGAALTDGKSEVIVTTKKGKAIRFKEEDIRSMGRTAQGVKGIDLKGDDEVASFDLLEKGNKRPKGAPTKASGEAELLVVTENGYGKRTALSEYRAQKRGGTGVATANITKKTGDIVASRVLTDEEELFALSRQGKVIRTQIKSVRQSGRSTQGVSIMNVGADDQVAAIVVV